MIIKKITNEQTNKKYVLYKYYRLARVNNFRDHPVQRFFFLRSCTVRSKNVCKKKAQAQCKKRLRS